MSILNKSAFLGFHHLASQVHRDFAESSRRQRSLGDCVCEDVRTGKVVGFFEAFVSEPEAGKSPLAGLIISLEKVRVPFSRSLTCGRSNSVVLDVSGRLR
jgi:hypothetical protein